MARTHIHLRVPVVVSLTLVLLLTPLIPFTAAAQAPVANVFTSVNGTVFGYSAEWTLDATDEAPDGILLNAGEAMIALGDMATDPGPEAIYEENFSSFPNIIDRGPTPDGGYYGLAWGQTNAGQWMHVIFRAMYAPGTSTPVIVLVATPEGTLDQVVASLQGVTANGIPVLDGLDVAATLATFEADGPAGAPVFTGGQASRPSPTEASTTTGTEVAGPAGTLFSWSDAWAYEPMEGMPASIVVLYGIQVPASLMIFEGAAGQGVDEMWAEYSSTGGEILDEGLAPDGGSYEISFNESDPVMGGGPSYTFTRAYPSDPSPILVSLIITGTDFGPSLAAARAVTTNGISILEGVDDAALMAVFENNGPTGTSIFTGGEAPASTDATGSGGGTESGGTSMRDVIASVPGLPQRNSDPTPEAEDESSYTSEMFDYTLAWENSWVPDQDGSEVNEDDGYDYFLLTSGASDDVMASVLGTEWDDEYRADDYIEYWASDEYVEENFLDGTEVLLVDGGRSSGAVVYVGPWSEDDPGLRVIIYEIVNIDGDVRIDPSFAAPLADFEDRYEDATQSITVNGDPVFGYFSTDEIMDELPDD